MKKGEKTMLGMTWMSYLGSAYGCLKQSGLWDGELDELFGLTGMGYHFIMHESLCPSSPTVYNWLEEHFDMFDRIGVYTRQEFVFKSSTTNTFDLARKAAIPTIEQAIEDGKPVITWGPTHIPEFGIIYGYDPEDKVFFVEDCMPEDPDPLLYDNLGLSDVPIFYVQYLVDKTHFNYEASIINALKFGLNYWHSQVTLSPKYTSGEKAYEVTINALEKGEFDPFGLSYCINVYADMKLNMMKFFERITKKEPFAFLTPVLENYRQVVEAFSQATKKAPFYGPGGEYHYTDETKKELAQLMKVAMENEEKFLAVAEENINN
ncbi:MAG: hypothetical protein ACOC34_06325 [Thermotogota bacterium]